MKQPGTLRTAIAFTKGKLSGDYFLDSLWSDINSLRLYAGVHTVYHGYHRLLSKRFPFAIYYRIEGRIARVRAVLDCRRDPVWISERLR